MFILCLEFIDGIFIKKIRSVLTNLIVLVIAPAQTTRCYGFDGQVKGKGILKCLDPQTGTVKWQQRGFGTGTVLVAGERLIILGEKGLLVIAKAQPDAYVELAQAQILNGKCWTVPCLAHGLLYARDAKGNLVCLDLRETSS